MSKQIWIPHGETWEPAVLNGRDFGAEAEGSDAATLEGLQALEAAPRFRAQASMGPSASHRGVVRIVIADDHELLRDGLRRVLESQPDFKVVGEASDGYEVVQLAKRLKPSLVLLDMSMPRRDGIEALRELSLLQQGTKYLMLTASLSRDDIVQALKLGALGVLFKGSTTGGLFEAIRCVMAGQYWVDRQSVSDLVKALKAVAPGAREGRTREFGLTPREVEVISMVVVGYSNAGIADRCHISEQTVKHHLGSIFSKLGVTSRLELALFAVKHNLASPVE